MVSDDVHSRWGVLGRVVVFMIAGAVMLAVISPLVARLPAGWAMVVLGTVTGLGVFALTILFVRWERCSLDDVGAAPRRQSLARFVLGFLIGLLLVALSMLIQTLAGHLRWVRTPAVGFAPMMITLIGFVALSCREELAFHGYPLRSLQRSIGVWQAQIIVALVFAFEHLAGGWPLSRAVLGAGAGSLVFGMAAIATKGLALPIGMHAAWNFANSMIGQNYAPGLWKAVVDPGQAQHVQNLISISYLVAMGLALTAFWWWHRRINRIEKETSLPNDLVEIHY